MNRKVNDVLITPEGPFLIDTGHSITPCLIFFFIALD